MSSHGTISTRSNQLVREHFRRDGGAKKEYSTKEQAVLDQPTKRPYECGFCNHWHVSST